MIVDYWLICKFDIFENFNYIFFWNVFVFIVGKFIMVILELKQQQQCDRIKLFKKYLDVFDVLDDDFIDVCEVWMDGLCGWILIKVVYFGWRDGEFGNNRMFWIKGKLVIGKFVFVGYVID